MGRNSILIYLVFIVVFCFVFEKVLFGLIFGQHHFNKILFSLIKRPAGLRYLSSEHRLILTPLSARDCINPETESQVY